MLAARTEQVDSGALLRTDGVTRVFGTGSMAVTAVENVTMSIQPGQVVSLVGESGSGKSTLARMLLRLLPPTKGSIWFKGNVVTARRSRANDLAYWRQVQAVFQDPFASFNAFFTVRSTLRRSLGILPASLTAEEQEDRMREALALVGLNPDEMLPKRPFELSGGQRQRVMVARALMVQPQLLIADEPTSAIDASTRASVLNVLLDLQRTLGMSILFITHDIGLAYYTSEQILVMHNGQLVEAGSAEQVVHDPQHSYTQRLLADVPRLHQAARA